MTEETFREARTLLLESDPDKIGRGLALVSIKDATFVHQRYALAQGYNSVLELAIDELAAEITTLKARVEALEQHFDQQLEIEP